MSTPREDYRSGCGCRRPRRSCSNGLGAREGRRGCARLVSTVLLTSPALVCMRMVISCRCTPKSERMLPLSRRGRLLEQLRRRHIAASSTAGQCACRRALGGRDGLDSLLSRYLAELWRSRSNKSGCMYRVRSGRDGGALGERRSQANFGHGLAMPPTAVVCTGASRRVGAPTRTKTCQEEGWCCSSGTVSIGLPSIRAPW